MAMMTSITCHNYQDWRDSRIQELNRFKYKSRVGFLKHSISITILLHFKCMIKLVGIGRILNNSADRINQIYIVELHDIGTIQFWQ